MLKALFVREIIKYFPDFFRYVEKRLDSNVKVFDVTDWTTIIILFNISRSKGNQRMKFCQLIEYNMRNILEKSHTKCGGEASPNP